MNISIRGKLHKVYSGWAAVIPILDCVIKEERPLMCLKRIEQLIKEELGDQNLTCFFRVDDSGVFYFITSNTPNLIDLIAHKMVDLEAVRIEADFD